MTQPWQHPTRHAAGTARTLARLATVAGLLAALAAPAAAQAPAIDPRAAGYLAGNCANCHGTNGRNDAGLPVLAGQPRERIAELLRGYRDGKIPATLMHQHAKGYTDAQIDALAEFFSRQPAK